MNDDLITLREAASELYRAVDTLRKYAQRRNIPAKKIIGRWYLPKAWVEEQKRTPQEPLWAKPSAQPEKLALSGAAVTARLRIQSPRVDLFT